MSLIDQASNAELLSRLAGPRAAQLLLERYGGLSALVRAPVDELRQLRGIGPARAAAPRAAFFLGNRLRDEAFKELPVLDTPDHVAGVLREANRLYTVEHK